MEPALERNFIELVMQGRLREIGEISTETFCSPALLSPISSNSTTSAVNIFSIFGGENALGKKGVGGKRENLEEGEIASGRRETTRAWHVYVCARVRTTTPHAAQPTLPAHPPLCPLLTISSLSTDPFPP